MKLEDLKELDWNICGIYIIKCLVSGNCYVGQSVDIRKRLREHIYALNKKYKRSKSKYEENDHLRKAWSKYGEENFNFSILEICDISLLNEKEKYWIKYYDSYDNGYNMTSGGQDNFCKPIWDEKTRKKLSDIKNPKPVLQIDFNGNIVNEYWSVAHAGRVNNIDGRGIYSCCNKRLSKSSKGYIWCYKEDYDNGLFDLDYYLDKKEKKVIEQYDMYGNFIKVWDDGCSVKQDGFNPSTINSCCNHKSMSVNGYIWKFKDDDSRIIDEEYCELARKKLESVKVRKVYQLDLNDNLISIYDSIKSTKKDGYISSQVSLCCRHKKDTYKNYKWIFEEEFVG